MTQKIWTGRKAPRKASFGIVKQHQNPDANHRRAAKRRIGNRQFKKMRRAMRAQGAARTVSALLESLRLHQPLPTWAPPPAAPVQVAMFRPGTLPAPNIADQHAIKFDGHLFFVSAGTDEDGAWVDRVQISGAWWDAEEVLSLQMRNTLGELLTSKLLAEAAEDAQP